MLAVYYSTPNDLENFKFYVPDTFDCLSVFQKNFLPFRSLTCLWLGQTGETFNLIAVEAASFLVGNHPNMSSTYIL